MACSQSLPRQLVPRPSRVNTMKPFCAIYWYQSSPPAIQVLVTICECGPLYRYTSTGYFFVLSKSTGRKSLHQRSAPWLFLIENNRQLPVLYSFTGFSAEKIEEVLPFAGLMMRISRGT